MKTPPGNILQMATQMDSVNGAGKNPEPEPNPREQSPPTGSSGNSGVIGKYMELTKDIPSPAVFRLWTAIHAVGAAAERRVWTGLGLNKLHANLFVFLVGPPGTGKSQALNPMTGLLRKAQCCGLAPNDLTKQGLLDALADCTGAAIIDGRPFDYHFMAICISELSNLMSQYDKALAGLLTDLFDCPAINEERKRSGAGEAISFPGISFLMGTATRNLGDTIPTELWGSGFMARVIMIYSDQKVIPKDIFKKVSGNTALEEQIVLGLSRIGELKGEMMWMQEAQGLLQNFMETQEVGAPTHMRLTDYVTRRWLHLGKLCMISALSEERLVVHAADYHRAFSWLNSAEKVMPEIFKDMVHHEDGQILDELRQTFYQIYIGSNRQPVHYSVLAQFLSKRASSYQVPRMIDIACAADYFRRVAGTDGEDAYFVPQPNYGKPADTI